MKYLRHLLCIGIFLSGCLLPLHAKADLDALISNLNQWFQIYGQIDLDHSQVLAADLESLKNSLRTDCEREGLSRKGLDRNFFPIITALVKQKSVRKYSLTALGELTSCVTQNLTSWEKECKQRRPPYQTHCLLSGNGEKLVELSEDCKRVFIELDHLGQGGANTVSSALEYHPKQTPFWTSLVRRAPINNHPDLAKGLDIQEEITRNKLPNLMPVTYRRELISYSPLFDSDFFDARAKLHPTPSFMNEQSLRMSGVGVDALHENDIAHLDLKPENIMVNGAENPLTMDLKVADFDSGEKLPIRKTRGFGTPGFLAPEQMIEEIHGTTDEEKKRNTKSMDVFAFSVMTALALGNTKANFINLVNCQNDLISDINKSHASCLQKGKSRSKCATELETYKIQHKDRCQSVLNEFKEAIRTRDSNHENPLSENLRKLLVDGLDTDPTKRPTMANLKGAILDHTHERFHEIFNGPIQALAGSQMLDSREPGFYKTLSGKVYVAGFAFYSMEEPKTGALRIAMKVEGSAAPILIKSNPLINGGTDFLRETKELKDRYLTDNGTDYKLFNLNTAITLKRFSRKHEPIFTDKRLNEIDKMQPKQVIKITLPSDSVPRSTIPKYCDRLKIKLEPTTIQCIFGNQVREDLKLGEQFDYKIVPAPSQ